MMIPIVLLLPFYNHVYRMHLFHRLPHIVWYNSCIQPSPLIPHLIHYSSPYPSSISTPLSYSIPQIPLSPTTNSILSCFNKHTPLSSSINLLISPSLSIPFHYPPHFAPHQSQPLSLQSSILSPGTPFNNSTAVIQQFILTFNNQLCICWVDDLLSSLLCTLE